MLARRARAVVDLLRLVGGSRSQVAEAVSSDEHAQVQAPPWLQQQESVSLLDPGCRGGKAGGGRRNVGTQGKGLTPMTIHPGLQVDAFVRLDAAVALHVGGSGLAHGPAVCTL